MSELDTIGNWPVLCYGDTLTGRCKGDGTSPGKEHRCPFFWETTTSKKDFCNCCQACTRACAEDS